jgi:hypothetical protein
MDIVAACLSILVSMLSLEACWLGVWNFRGSPLCSILEYSSCVYLISSKRCLLFDKCVHAKVIGPQVLPRPVEMKRWSLYARLLLRKAIRLVQVEMIAKDVMASRLVLVFVKSVLQIQRADKIFMPVAVGGIVSSTIT